MIIRNLELFSNNHLYIKQLAHTAQHLRKLFVKPKAKMRHFLDDFLCKYSEYFIE